MSPSSVTYHILQTLQTLYPRAAQQLSLSSSYQNHEKHVQVGGITARRVALVGVLLSSEAGRCGVLPMSCYDSPSTRVIIDGRLTL